MSLSPEPLSPTVHKERFQWREFWLLWFAGLISIGIGVVPILSNVGRLSTRATVRSGVGFLVFVAILLAGFISFGLTLAKRISLPCAPILEEWLRGHRVGSRLLRLIPQAAGFALIYLVFAMAMQSRIAGLFGAPPSNKPAPPFFTIGPPGHTTQLHVSGLSGLAVAVGFPLFEELVFRLFLFTFLAWVTAKLLRTSSCVPSSALWVVNFIQAYCFGLFHVPNGSLIWWEPWYLQALAAPQCWLGLLTGYLYWRHGLESAVLAHLSADLMLVVAITLL